MTASQHPADIRSACQIYRWRDEAAAEGRDTKREKAIRLARLEATEDVDGLTPVTRAIWNEHKRRADLLRRAVRDFIGLLVILAALGWLFGQWVQPGGWLR